MTTPSSQFSYIPSDLSDGHVSRVEQPAPPMVDVPLPERVDADLSSYYASRRQERGERITIKLDDQLTIHVQPWIPGGVLVDGLLTGDEERYAIELLSTVVAPGEWEKLRAWMDRAEVDTEGLNRLGQEVTEQIQARPIVQSST